MTGSPVRRVRGRQAVAVLLVVLAAAAAWLAVRGLRAQDALEQARASLTTARAALAGQDLAAASAAVRTAGAQTARARSLTGDPVWAATSAVPYAGHSLQVARALAVSSDDLARDVLPGLVAAVQQADPQRLRGPDGRVDLARLRALAAPLSRAATATTGIADRSADLPRTGLVPPVQRARQDFLGQVRGLRDTVVAADRAVAIAPALLGGDRPRTYLLLVQQTAESRGTGGIPGGYAAVRVDGGRLTVLRSGSNAQLRNGYVPPPPGVPADWVARYRDLGALDLWQNVTMSPDLPVVARAVQSRWRALGGTALDGVITLDGRALAAVLRGSPPLTLSDGTRLPADRVQQFVSVEQYRGTGSDQSARKERLDEIADVALSRLAGGGGSSAALLRGVAEAVRSGHLRMASDDPVLAPVLASSGVDGALPDGSAPVAYAVVTNTIAGKLDDFLDRTVVYRADGCGAARRRSSITTTLRLTPPADLPEYNRIRIVDDVQTLSTTGQVSLNVYGTRGAQLVRATLDGRRLSGGSEPRIAQGSEAGLPVWTVFVDLPPGRDRVLTLDLVEPTLPGAARVPEQPLGRDLVRRVDVPTC